MHTTEAAKPQFRDLETSADSVASFEIWPHRSLGRRGTGVLLTFVASAAAFIATGSPPTAQIPMTAGALTTVGALALALWCNNRAARYAEIVQIDPKVLRVTRSGRTRAARHIEFATGWVRVALTDDGHGGNRLVLSESGRRCVLGTCLSPMERQALATALHESLARARSCSPSA